MNKIITMLLCLILVIPITGCQVTITKPPTSQPALTTETRVRNASSIATGVYLLTVKDKTQRVKIAGEIQKVLTEVNKYTANQYTSLTDLRVFTTGFILSSNIENKEAITLLLNSVSMLVEQEIGTVTLEKKTQINIVTAATSGVNDAIKLYAQP